MKRTLLAAPLCAALQALAQTPAAEPCTDFYTWVNHRWLAANPLPPDRARVGSFDTLRVDSARLLQGALAQQAASGAPAPSEGIRLVADDFAAGMDTAAIESRGLAALEPWLGRIAGLQRADALPALMGELARIGVSAPLAPAVGPDAKDKRRYALVLRQAGLTLPDRDDYGAADGRAPALRSAWRAYARVLLDGADEATLDAVFALERRLAAATVPRAQQRDPNTLYNPFSPAALQAATPDFDWPAWFAAYGAPGVARVVVGEPGFAMAVAQAAAEVPLPTWRAYLRLRLLDVYAPRLPQRYEQAAFAFHGTAVRGLRQPLPRAERVLQSIGDGPVNQALGELYVARAFSPLAQQRMQQMVADLKSAMRARIQRLDWMSAPTKARAIAKLDALVPKIGAPAQWRRYDGLVLRRDDHAGNAVAAAAWQTAERLADLPRPVDRTRWNTSPHVVNAFAGALNDISFPAAILQPPFFDPTADDAWNYGAIGAVIGHEITHHFDDRGRRFDADGNLADWWTEADAAAYRARADRLAALYDGYEAAPGQRINGRQTLGENISDLSGVAIAHDALQLALARRGSVPTATGPDGLTPSQRFFVGFATMWRSHQRVESLVNQLRTGSHAPGPFRVQGPLSNTPAFAAAFQCKAGSAMVAAEPIAIW